jgi:predicted  nucleic acid-binding Zn-ribbon protein
MSDIHVRTRAPRRTARTVPIPAPAPPLEVTAEGRKTATEVTVLVRLAEMDSSWLARQEERREPGADEVANERRALAARLSPDILEAYERALRGGRQPAVVSLVASVCSGCHVRLHSTLEQKVRRRRGVAPCPHCLRLVYDTAWLDPAAPRE